MARPPTSPERVAAIVAALSLPGATVRGVALSSGMDRETVRRIRRDAGLIAAPPVRPSRPDSLRALARAEGTNPMAILRRKRRESGG
jgi:transposase-like protein